MPRLVSGANRARAWLAAALTMSILVLPPVPGTSSFMDPETSYTASTLLRLRAAFQLCRAAATTWGAGGASTLAGWSGSSPLAWLSCGPGRPSEVRNPASWNRVWIGSLRR